MVNLQTSERGNIGDLKASLLILLLACPTVMVGAKEAASEGITFSYKARSLQPGDVVFLEVKSQRPMTGLSASAFGREFPVFCDSGGLECVALVGIDLDTQPGTYVFRISGEGPYGRPMLSEQGITVAAKKFPTRRLTVDEKYVTPPPEALIRIKQESARVNAIFKTRTPERYWDGPFLLPVPGQVISEFGKRSVYNGQQRSAHTGVDLRGATGTPVQAPNAGKVVLAEPLYYSGKTVIIDHGLSLYSYFGHLSALTVKERDFVNAGDLVGKVGATGLVTGPHLHWTVRLAGTRVDPLSLVSVLEARTSPSQSAVR